MCVYWKLKTFSNEKQSLKLSLEQTQNTFTKKEKIDIKRILIRPLNKALIIFYYPTCSNNPKKKKGPCLDTGKQTIYISVSNASIHLHIKLTKEKHTEPEIAKNKKTNLSK